MCRARLFCASDLFLAGLLPGVAAAPPARGFRQRAVAALPVPAASFSAAALLLAATLASAGPLVRLRHDVRNRPFACQSAAPRARLLVHFEPVPQPELEPAS